MSINSVQTLSLHRTQGTYANKFINNLYFPKVAYRNHRLWKRGLICVKQSVQKIFRERKTPRGLESSWRSCVLHTGALPPFSPYHVQVKYSGQIRECSLSQWCKTKRVPGQGRELSTTKPGSIQSQSDSPPTKSLKGGRASWPKVQAQQESGQRILSGRDLIGTVRKVKAEELITPTDPEKGQCELSSCSIWCQRPWLLSSTPRQFRPPRSAPPRKANSALKGNLLVSSRESYS